MLSYTLFLAVLGSSTCFRRDDFPSSHPTYPSGKPSQSQWDPGHSSPYGSHSANWHNHGYHDAVRWLNPGGGQMNDEQWPDPSQSAPHYDQTGYYAPDENSDDQSDTDSDSEETGQDGGTPSGTDDQAKYPSQSNNQGSDSNIYQSIPEASDKNNQDYNNGTQGVDQARTPLDFDIQKPNVNVNNMTLESEITGPIAVVNPNPFEFNNENDRNRGDIPESDIRISNISKPIAWNNQDGYPVFKPVADLTSGIALRSNETGESNETQIQAYITGPDNTLRGLKTNQTETNDTKSQRDTLKPPKVFFPSTPAPAPRPSIGSIPVPVLSQSLAPSLQWNVGIYTKMETPYSQICGGSLVKTDVVLSAAHCFWSGDGGALRPSLFAAAAGKLRRAWDAASDAFAQHSDIKEIHIPPRFLGAMNSFQDDIAIARLTTPFEFGPGVKPVCLNFDVDLEREQLQETRKGTIVGWGLTQPNGPPSERLNFLELPYLEIKQCIKRVQPSFLKYITSDKICAGDFTSGFAACKGDSGSGLVFTTDNVPYLRGVVSTAPRDQNQCNAFTPATFTHVASHATFLADHIPNADEDCRSLYEARKTVRTDEVRNAKDSENSTVADNSQIKLNVTLKTGDGELHEPVPLPLTASFGQSYECKCTCN